MQDDQIKAYDYGRSLASVTEEKKECAWLALAADGETAPRRGLKAVAVPICLRAADALNVRFSWQQSSVLGGRYALPMT